MSNTDTVAAIALLAELALLGLKRMAEFGEAIARMRAGGPEVTEEEIAKAGLAAEAAILRARLALAAPEPPPA